MSDFNLEDILAEVENKRTKSRASGSDEPTPEGYAPDFDVDDILNEILGSDEAKKPAKPAKNAKAAEKERRRAEIAEQKRREAQEKEEERRRKAAEEQQRIAEERERKAREERERREARQKELEEATRKKREELAEEQRRAEMKLRKAAEEAEERKRLALEEERRKEEEKARLAALDAAERELAEREAAKKRREAEESERRYATKNIVFEEAPIELPKIEEPQAQKPAPATEEELALENELREKKLESQAQKRLEREIGLEDPDDFLSAINPYDSGSAPSLTGIIETIPAQQLSGDTVSVAGNELKELARASAGSDRSIDDIVGGETRVMPELSHSEAPAFDLDKTFVLGDTNEIKPFAPKATAAFSVDTVEVKKQVKSDPLLASINKTLEQKRIEDIQAQSPYSVTAQLEVQESKTPTNTISPDIDSIKMPHTGAVPIANPVINEQKIKYLNSKRKRKLSDFVLEDIRDDDDDFDYDDDDDTPEISDEDDGQIWQDLTETHKSLRLRFILLLIITLIVGGVTLAQEFGASLSFNLFGAQIDFLDKKFDPNGFIYFNLCAGVIGMALCASAIRGGLSKLFRGRGDCDSACAAVSVLALLGGVLHLINTDDLQRSNAFLFITPALAGLLFNTLGKLSMISRARRNFRFISAEANRYYADVVEDESEVSAFTKGVVTELPFLVTMRKTEILTDFLRKSYCEDKSDRISRTLTLISLCAGAFMGLLTYFIPHSLTTMTQNNIYWASTVFIGFVCIFAPFSTMFLVNNPLRRATKALEKSGSTILGYSTAEKFSRTNAVMTDVSAIFPASSVECTNLKPCRLQNSINNISLDQAIILAASLAIKTNSVLSRLFYEMIGGKEELLADIDGCVYEDNMGVMGWYGNKRLIMGNREHMKHHSIKVPEMTAIAKYCRNGSDAVYLAVGGELTIIFFIRLTANHHIRDSLRELSDRGVSLIVKTTDSLVTVGKIADLFDLDPEKIKVLGSNLHEQFNEATKYTSNGCGAITSNGNFAGFARAICAAKKIMKDVNISQMVMLAGVFLAAVLGVFLALSTKTLVFSPAVITLYQLFWLLPVFAVQAFRKY